MHNTNLRIRSREQHYYALATLVSATASAAVVVSAVCQIVCSRPTMIMPMIAAVGLGDSATVLRCPGVA